MNLLPNNPFRFPVLNKFGLRNQANWTFKYATLPVRIVNPDFDNVGAGFQNAGGYCVVSELFVAPACFLCFLVSGRTNKMAVNV